MEIIPLDIFFLEPVGKVMIKRAMVYSISYSKSLFIFISFSMNHLQKIVLLKFNYSRNVWFSFQCMLGKVGNWNFDIFLFDRLTNGK